MFLDSDLVSFVAEINYFRPVSSVRNIADQQFAVTGMTMSVDWKKGGVPSSKISFWSINTCFSLAVSMI